MIILLPTADTFAGTLDAFEPRTVARPNWESGDAAGPGNYQAKFLVSTDWIAGNETDKLIEKMVGHPIDINEEFDFDSLIGNQFQITIKTVNGLDRATDVTP